MRPRVLHTQVQQEMRVLRSTLANLMTREGCRLRSIRNRRNDPEDHSLTYARFLHSMLSAPGSQGDKVLLPARACACLCLSPASTLACASHMCRGLRAIHGGEGGCRRQGSGASSAPQGSTSCTHSRT